MIYVLVYVFLSIMTDNIWKSLIKGKKISGKNPVRMLL